ncbi:MAG: PaaI family thioesterase [Hydrogenobacter thermophilus]|uniref:Thioesterase family protein n=1 Tax=Hydrogenobacter thermophilus (strain DSM 6534 / IAM 12695 / TK-6) TaxID=608538 RepID=D3DI65_HYDTT|nr:PaaI family thioesterase [Hydrogenobacter thermophilus]ADO45446.1 thioesterase superfamily protein [Hydrogenobacter thermophilus TK-6]QWK20343.1 MAG: PaaI family thioesterase [Hydrogenobacter thermophilus]BAI69517.1 thioesterase family protein [Hydrogenobacter thermophilus TK-6]
MRDLKLPFLEHIGAVVEELSKDRAILSIDVQEYHLQHLGYVHGGVISSLADNTGWYAVIANLSESKTSVTIEIKINYLKPAKMGKLKAVGKVIKIGKRVAFAVVEVYMQDELVAYATGTYAILEKEVSHEGMS